MKKRILITCLVLAAFSLSAFALVKWDQPQSQHPGCKPSGAAHSACKAAENGQPACKSAAQEHPGCKSAETAHPGCKSAEAAHTVDKPPMIQYPGCKAFVKDPEFDAEIDSRFIWQITKSKLHKAQKIFDVFPEAVTAENKKFTHVRVCQFLGEEKIIENGTQVQFNSAQLALIRSTDYSSDMYVMADYEVVNPGPGEPNMGEIIYYLTVVPEQQARYSLGKDGLLNYLLQNSLETRAGILRNLLTPGRVNFTISPEGKVSEVKLGSSCSWPDVDQNMLDLITNMPGQWEPAANADGEKVAQELVFFFGRRGC